MHNTDMGHYSLRCLSNISFSEGHSIGGYSYIIFFLELFRGKSLKETVKTTSAWYLKSLYTKIYEIYTKRSVLGVAKKKAKNRSFSTGINEFYVGHILIIFYIIWKKNTSICIKLQLKTKLIRFFVYSCTKNKKVSDKHFPSNYTHEIQTLTKS